MALLINPADITCELVERYTYRELDQATRQWWRAKLCQDAIDIVGIAHRNKHGNFICLKDVDAHQEELLKLLPLVNVFVPSNTRQGMYGAASPKTLARNLLSALLRSTNRMGTRKGGQTKVEGKWKPCMDWQVLE